MSRTVKEITATSRIATEFPKLSQLKEKLERVASCLGDRQAIIAWDDMLADAISEHSGIPKTYLDVSISLRCVEISTCSVVHNSFSIRIDFREDRFASVVGSPDTYDSISAEGSTAVFFRNVGRKFGANLRKYVRGSLSEARSIVNLAHIMGVSA